MEYTFTLNYQIAPNADTDELLERLGVAGCNDALVGVGRPGHLTLEFSREADTAEQAARTALAEVGQAVPSARLIEASPVLEIPACIPQSDLLTDPLNSKRDQT